MKIARVFVVALVATAVVVVLAERRRRRPTTVVEVSDEPLSIPGALGAFVAVLNSAESEDDPAYRDMLGQMRHDAARVLADADDFMRRAGDGHFALRHSVVMAIAAMREPSALGLLEKVALNPQPLPPRVTPEHVEPFDVEDAVQGTIVALDAIDGIEALADDGQKPAVEALVRASRVPSNAIRAAALTALAARPERASDLQRALAELPHELRHLAALRRTEVGEVPQVRDPRATLIGADSHSSAAPPLDGSGSRERPAVTDRGGAPTIRGR